MTRKLRSSFTALLGGALIAILQVTSVLAAGRWG
jgi:hypothetical protein